MNQFKLSQLFICSLPIPIKPFVAEMISPRFHLIPVSFFPAIAYDNVLFQGWPVEGAASSSSRLAKDARLPLPLSSSSSHSHLPGLEKEKEGGGSVEESGRLGHWRNSSPALSSPSHVLFCSTPCFLFQCRKPEEQRVAFYQVRGPAWEGPGDSCGGWRSWGWPCFLHTQIAHRAGDVQIVWCHL